MAADKPIFVHHDGKWRRYLGSRAFLACTTIGDVIPVLPSPLCDDPAPLYLRARPAARADVLCVDAVTDLEWNALSALINEPIDTFDYMNPFV